MASTNLIGDISTVITNGPNAASTAKAIAASGPILDYPGMTLSLKLTFQEAQVLLARLITDTDSTDSANLALLTGVAHALVGTSAPSAHVIADMNTVETN